MATRRDFLRASAGVGAGALGGVLPAAVAAAPAVRIKRVTPTCVASGNGVAAVARALEELEAGATTIEAVVRGVNLVEEAPDDSSVGYGGLPNQVGVVQLDSSLMHGPTRGAGAVAAFREAIRAEPWFVSPYEPLMLLLEAGGDSVAADRVCEGLRRINPSLPADCRRNR